jgi:hypothetical protein
MLVDPAAQILLGTLPPAERDELLGLIGQAAAGEDRARAEDPAP